MNEPTMPPPVEPLAKLPRDLAALIDSLITEGARSPVVATAIIQAAGNLIGQYAAANPEENVDQLIDRFVRRIAHAVHTQVNMQAAARLGGGLH